MAHAGVALGLDVGGSSIKYGLVDLATGHPTGPLASVPTPQPATADALFDAMTALARAAPDGTPMGAAMPCVIQRGIIHTAANLDDSLIGLDAHALLGARIGRAPVLLNDADAAGLAEAHWGAARGVAGTVMLLTLGTGIGSAMIVGGRLWPNTELGHLEVDGVDAESRASARARSSEGLDWPQWADRVNRYLHEINRLFWPDRIVIAGGVVENWARFEPLLKSRSPLCPAALGAAAGAAGAALAAAQAGA